MTVLRNHGLYHEIHVFHSKIGVGSAEAIVYLHGKRGTGTDGLSKPPLRRRLINVVRACAITAIDLLAKSKYEQINGLHAHLTSTTIHGPAAKPVLPIDANTLIPSRTVASISCTIPQVLCTVHERDIVVQYSVFRTVLELDLVSSLPTDDVWCLRDFVRDTAVIRTSCV